MNTILEGMESRSARLRSTSLRLKSRLYDGFRGVRSGPVRKFATSSTLPSKRFAQQDSRPLEQREELYRLTLSMRQSLSGTFLRDDLVRLGVPLDDGYDEAERRQGLAQLAAAALKGRSATKEELDRLRREAAAGSGLSGLASDDAGSPRNARLESPRMVARETLGRLQGFHMRRHAAAQPHMLWQAAAEGLLRRSESQRAGISASS